MGNMWTQNSLKRDLNPLRHFLTSDFEGSSQPPKQWPLAMGDHP